MFPFGHRKFLRRVLGNEIENQLFANVRRGYIWVDIHTLDEKIVVDEVACAVFVELGDKKSREIAHLLKTIHEPISIIINNFNRDN